MYFFLFTHVGYSLLFLSLDSPTYYSTFLTKIMAASFFYSDAFPPFPWPLIGRHHVALNDRQARKLAKVPPVLLSSTLFYSQAGLHSTEFSDSFIYIKC